MAWGTKIIMNYFITTIDYNGYYQPYPPAPHWPHISELLAQGWVLVCLFNMERQETMALFARNLFDGGTGDNLKNQ